MKKTIPNLEEYVDHFRARVLQDALAEATSSYWLRRAEAFAGVGNERCDSVAQACRNAAQVALLQDEKPLVSAQPIDELERRRYDRDADHRTSWPAAEVVCPECGTPTSPWSCSCGATRVDGGAR